MSSLLQDVPSIESFPTVDQMLSFAEQLASGYPDRVRLRVCGHSRAGDPIQLLSIRCEQPIGDILVIGQPHPNEPIGMATIQLLCNRLLDETPALDETRLNWHVIPCADPDGTRLNEGWFAGPFTREHYARHYYRPGADAQVEWTFPFSTDGFSVDAPLPETRALMAAIDEVRPTALVSLHNSELGGAYFYATEGTESVYGQLSALCEERNIPLHLGEPEFPLSSVLAPAVYSVPTAEQMHQLAMAVGIDPAVIVSGGSSLDYARRYGNPVGLVVELPYWRDGRAADESEDPSGRSRRDVVITELDAETTSMTTIRDLVEAAGPLPPSPLADAVLSFLQAFAAGYSEERRQQAMSDPAYEQTATVAEAFSSRDEHVSFRLRMLGMLLRALPADSARRADAEQLFEQWAADAAAGSKADVIPIRDLVAVQIGTILAAVESATRHQTTR